MPSHLPRLDPARAFATIRLPLHLNWSEPGRRFDLRDSKQRGRVYEVVLREGTEEDIRSYVDGVPLVELWPDLVLPRAIRAAWEPVVSSASPAA